MSQYIKSDAIISDCGNFRYQLNRVWDESLPIVPFIMLNPSTADGNIDDPTIRRCVGFAKQWGYGGLIVVNLYALRATNPKSLLESVNPFGDDNQLYLEKIFNDYNLIVAAWGNSSVLSKIQKSNKLPLKGLQCSKLHYIELSQDGTPKHPLYLKYTDSPKPFFNN